MDGKWFVIGIVVLAFFAGTFVSNIEISENNRILTGYASVSVPVSNGAPSSVTLSSNSEYSQGFTNPEHHSIPTKMSLQGKVTDFNGNLIDGNLGVKIGDSNSCITQVFFDYNYFNAIEDGKFNVLLGQNEILPLNFNQDYFMCLYVNGELLSGPQVFRGGQGEVHQEQLFDGNSTNPFDFNYVNVNNDVNVNGLLHIISQQNSSKIKLSTNVSGFGVSDGFDINTSDSNAALTLYESGNFWINGTDVNGNPLKWVQFSNNGSLTFATIPGTSQSLLPLQIRSGGIVSYQVSSQKFKTNIQPITIDTSKLYDLQPVSFVDKKTGESYFGLIAEDVYSKIPELVPLDEEGQPLSVSYSMLSVIELNELKKLKAENDALKQVICNHFPQESICAGN